LIVKDQLTAEIAASGLSEHGFQVSGLRPALAFSLLTPYMKLHIVGTKIRLNVEHRTPNIERRILMTLRFIDFKTSEPQNMEYKEIRGHP
jgi:hypothetical protein